MFNYPIVWRTNNVIYDNPRVHLCPKWQRNLSFPWASQSPAIPHKQFQGILIHMQRLGFGDVHITNSARIWCTFLRSVASTQPNVTCSKSCCYCYDLKQKFHFPVCCRCRSKEMFLDQVICFCRIRVLCFSRTRRVLLWYGDGPAPQASLTINMTYLPRFLLHSPVTQLWVSSTLGLFFFCI